MASILFRPQFVNRYENPQRSSCFVSNCITTTIKTLRLSLSPPSTKSAKTPSELKKRRFFTRGTRYIHLCMLTRSAETLSLWCCNIVVIVDHDISRVQSVTKRTKIYTWVRSQNCGCLVTWFCYQLIAKPGNKTATVARSDPYAVYTFLTAEMIVLPPPISRFIPAIWIRWKYKSIPVC